MKWKELLGRKDVFILDTETTGLGTRAEIIEIAIIDTTGTTRFESLCKPQRPVPKSATRINRITNRMVEKAQKWAAIHGSVVELFQQADHVLAWNAEFDEKMLKQTAKRYRLRWRSGSRFHDLLGDYRTLRPDLMRYRLKDACSREGVPRDESKAHRALADCYDVLAVMRACVTSNI